MYRHFGGVVSLYVEWGFVRDLVLYLGGVIAKFPKFRETNDSGWL